jgi:hypothetical protein
VQFERVHVQEGFLFVVTVSIRVHVTAVTFVVIDDCVQVGDSSENNEDLDEGMQRQDDAGELAEGMLSSWIKELDRVSAVKAQV